MPSQRGRARAARPSTLPAGNGAPSPAGETREKLLVAIHELLYERVGGPVSVNEVCARAGANVAMVKYCFGSKGAMLIALIDRLVTSFTHQLEKLDQRQLNATDKLRIHVAEIVRNYVRYPYLNRLLSTQIFGAEPKGAAMLARDFAIPARDWYRQLLAQGHAAGEFRKVDPTLFFFTVIGLSEFFFTAQPLLRELGIRKIDAATIDHFIAHVTEMVLHGVRPTAPLRASRAPRIRTMPPNVTRRR